MEENEIPAIYLKLKLFHWRFLSLAQSKKYATWWHEENESGFRKDDW